MISLSNIGRLGVKELHSLHHDRVLSLLIVYAFTFAVYAAGTGETLEIRDASLALVDEDRSVLSHRIRDAFRPPEFQEPAELSIGEVDRRMARGDYTFVVDIPPDFEADVVAGRSPALQVLVDATAMSQAGRGAGYVERIVRDEVARFVAPADEGNRSAPKLMVRAVFNPNLTSSWFGGTMEVVSNVTMLAIILTGAAMLREREHGTLEHLLGLPLRPVEIMLAKIWANAAVVVAAAVLSLVLVVRLVLGVPLGASIALFGVGCALYAFSVAALGILLSTLSKSMPQFGLLSIPVFLTLMLLSGSYTPPESIPPLLRGVMSLAPSTHFVSFSKAVLFRDASAQMVLPQVLAILGTGALFFALSLARFRASVTLAR